MRSPLIDNLPKQFSKLPIEQVVFSSDLHSLPLPREVEYPPIRFCTAFQGCMEMYSDLETVTSYLNAHEGWFCRCAEPMQVESLGDNGYLLVIGRFGAFGYEVEPKVAVVLQSSENGVYHMRTIPIPNYTPNGYEVNYQAWMELSEISSTEAATGIKKVYKKNNFSQLPPVITQVKWQLYLDVKVEFPKFICKLPLSLIQSTGDRLLCQIIKQVSPRLTYKVQEDFHNRLNLPIPPKGGREFRQVCYD